MGGMVLTVLSIVKVWKGLLTALSLVEMRFHEQLAITY